LTLVGMIHMPPNCTWQAWGSKILLRNSILWVVL
jgi:hypothetical protein